MKRIFIVILVLVLAGVLVRHFWTSENARIEKRFHTLARCVSKEPGETTSQLVWKMQILESLFTDPCVFRVPRFDLVMSMSPREIVSEATRVRPMFTRLKLSFYDLTVTEPAEEHAAVTCTALATGNSNDSRFEEIALINCTLRKVDGKWRFAEFAEVPVLEQ